MSMMALAAFLMARAETGQLRAARKGRLLVSAAVLKPLAAELEVWGFVAEIRPALLTLWQNGLLSEDAEGLLRPTTAAYSWLQLPPALSQRLWLEEPLDLAMAIKLINYGVVPDETNEAQFRRLALLGLLYWEEGRRYRATASAKDLLLALSRLQPEAGADDPSQLELAHACQVCFPGNLPGKGWLRWQQADFCFSFARPKVGQSFSFHPWQLFRLLTLCRLVWPEGAKVDRFYCQPDRSLVAKALQNGLEPSFLSIYLMQGSRYEMSESLTRTIKDWLADYKRLVVKDLTILEATNREMMIELISDRRLRSYLKPLLSARHAVVNRVTLRRLAALLERRGFYLYPPSDLTDVSSGRTLSNLVMTHSQLQELYTALSFYQWHLTQMGLDAISSNLGLELLQKQLSGGEVDEAVQEATRLINEFVSTGENIEPPPADEEQLRQHLEAVIAQDGEVWVEYYVPYRPPQRRRLKPHQIHEQNEYIYLIAHCYLRGGEREFRLDRLRLITPPLV